jgi:hypothetical protein
MQDLHLLPEAVAIGMTAEEGDRLGLIRVKAMLAANGGPAVSKDDMKFALDLFDRLTPVCDFDEEVRWKATCARKELAS